ncbi:hypothetical protein NPX13_g9580 [Xylaria arbuscula]|uniref:Rhodopsin domain-containing protein n=1 Tax=Xylaria arbuscula TaxID=114810 RepID=A0A9W8N6G3_9PEZI|nr:hypothetical protein NPX13_g9580 [Xylaria arbuscula]
MLYSSHVASNLYAGTMLLIKAAILHEWVTIFVPFRTRNYFFWLSYGILVFVAGLYSSAIISLNLSCIPFAAIFDLTIPAKCIDFKAVLVVGAAINLVSDVAIFALPQTTIWRLNMNKERKIGVSVVFATGIFAIVSAAARLAAAVQYTHSSDPTYDAAVLSLWAISEMTCAFLIYCIPSFPLAFSGPGVLSLFLASLRSWTGLRGPGSTKNSDMPWQARTGSDKQKFSDGSSEADSDVALSRLPVSGTSTFGKEGNPGGVLRTTHFTVSEDYVQGGGHRGLYQAQVEEQQRQWSNLETKTPIGNAV